MNAPQSSDSKAAAGPGAPLSSPAGNPQRKKALTALAGVVVVAGLGWAAYEYLVASHYESTDNAYVQGNVIQITPQIGGTVMALMADDTDFVKAGQPLVQLDPADAKVALDQAEAALAQAVRQARTLYANNGSLAAQIALREADVAKANSDIARAADDLKRRESLTGNGAVSKEELNHAQTQLANAKSALAAAQAGVIAAREQLSSNQALTEGTSIEQHPSVQVAAAKVREAFLASQRTALMAPVDGYVARRTVQLGQRVRRRHAADVGGAAEPGLGRCELQGSAAAQHPHRPAGDAGGRPVRQEGRLPRHASPAWASARARRFRCCPRRTPPATGSRWCSACRCASRSTPSN